MTAGNGTLDLSFTAPADNGGDDITGYQASTDGGQSWMALTVSGDRELTATLTAPAGGGRVHVLVRAESGLGTGSPVSGHPAWEPGAPRSVRVSQSGTAAVISWAAPADNGGAAIVRYTVTASPGGARCVTGGTSCRISGLPTGKLYTFSVTADNTTGGLPGTGVGPAGTSARTMISGLPGAPKLSGTAGDRSLGCTSPRAAPAARRSRRSGSRWTAAARWATVAGLYDGSTYRVAVAAVNAHGVGPAGTATVKLRAWFRDPVSKAARRHEVAVPGNPARYHGRLKATRATGRSHNGSPAISAGKLHGRQLQKGQAASLAVFRFDRAALTRTGRAQIAKLARSLRSAHAITCEGYTDYGGEAKHERTLAQRRAHAVCAQLARDGVHVRKTVHAYGAHRAVVIGGRPGNRSANRRVVVVADS